MRAQGRRRREWLALLVPVGALIVTALLLMLRHTTRWRTANGEALFARWQRGEQVILAFWHDQLVMIPLPYRGRRGCIMISQHRDGDLIARAVRPLGIDTVRGSSTRGWATGIRGMLRAWQNGADIAFVPDGPRGPRHVAKSGVIQIARATGAPIFAIGAAARRAVRLNSWDRLVIPLPGTVVGYVSGAPVRVDRDASAAELEGARLTLESELARATAAAEALVA